MVAHLNRNASLCLEVLTSVASIWRARQLVPLHLMLTVNQEIVQPNSKVLSIQGHCFDTAIRIRLGNGQ